MPKKENVKDKNTLPGRKRTIEKPLRKSKPEVLTSTKFDYRSCTIKPISGYVVEELLENLDYNLRLEHANILYSTIINHPKFTDKKWKSKTKFSEVYQYLMEQVKVCIGDKDLFCHLEVTNKSIILQRQLSHVEHFSGFPISALLPMEEKNPKLFDAVIKTISLLARKLGLLSYYDEAHDLNMIYEYINQEWDDIDEEDDDSQNRKTEFLKAFEYYTTGKPKELYDKIWKSDMDSFTTSLYIYRFLPEEYSPEDHEFQTWMLDVLKIVDKNRNINEFVNSITEDDYNAVSPMEAYKFIWSFKDYIQEVANEFIDNEANEYGIMPFSSIAIWHDGEYPIPEKTDFIQQLENIFNKLHELIENHYETE